MGVGFFELLILLGFVFGGGFALPMGMPPGPEDPLMFQVAPEECAFYATWTGVAALDKNANPTEAWIAQPGIQTSFKKLRSAFRGSIRNEISKTQDPAVKQLATVLLEVAEAATVNPCAFYLTDAEFNEGKPLIEGAAIVRLGEWADRVESGWQEFAATLDDESSIKKLELGGETVFQFAIPESKTEVTMALRGNYFAIGFGEGALAELAANSKTPPPKWVLEAREELKVDRFASMSYLDIKAVLDALPEEEGLGIWSARGIAAQFMIDDVNSLTWISGLDQQGFLTRCSVQTVNPLRGCWHRSIARRLGESS